VCLLTLVALTGIVCGACIWLIDILSSRNNAAGDYMIGKPHVIQINEGAPKERQRTIVSRPDSGDQEFIDGSITDN